MPVRTGITAYTEGHTAVADPDPEIRGGGGSL